MVVALRLNQSRYRYLALVIILLFLGCEKKSASTVFPEGALSGPPACDAQFIDGEYLVSWETGGITVERFQDDREVMEQFLPSRLPEIRFIEKNKVLSHDQPKTVVETSATNATWGLEMVRAQEVWAQGYRGDGVVVAVTDVRVDHTHAQLEGTIVKNNTEVNGVEGVDDDSNGFVDDIAGWDFENNASATPTLPGENHGSHVAGIIVAQTANSGIGMQGIAPNAKLLPLNIFDRSENGNLAWAVQAVRFADRRGAKVINASWGGPGCSETLRQEIDRLQSRVLFVAAAGNTGADLDKTYFLPASFQLSNSVTVGAIRSDGLMPVFSNSSYTFVHLLAPGHDVLSTVPGGVASFSGTSMAAPFVSGAAALLWSARPGATPQQIRAAILAGVDRGPYRVQSQGRLNAAKALAELRRMMP